MMLNDGAIAQGIKQGRIQIRPNAWREHLRPAGIRVHLGPTILCPEPGQLVDLAAPSEIKYKKLDLRREPAVLEPGNFVLASTLEQVRTANDILCILDGRSTIARLGLTVHNAASVLDGTHLHWLTPVLEITNHGNLRILLRPGIPIAMICFQQLQSGTSPRSYHSQYSGQSDTKGAVLDRGAIVLDIGARLNRPVLNRAAAAQLALFRELVADPGL